MECAGYQLPTTVLQTSVGNHLDYLGCDLQLMTLTTLECAGFQLPTTIYYYKLITNVGDLLDNFGCDLQGIRNLDNSGMHWLVTTYQLTYYKLM